MHFLWSHKALELERTLEIISLRSDPPRVTRVQAVLELVCPTDHNVTNGKVSFSTLELNSTLSVASLLGNSLLRILVMGFTHRKTD